MNALDRQSEGYEAFVPDFVRARIRRGSIGSPPYCETEIGAALFADISSFTACTERAFEAGPEGAEVIKFMIDCQGRSKFGPLRRSKSRPVGEGVAVFVGRLERSLRSPFRAAQA